MDTFLTLVIALGGIATGIGAIWTAMLARRQLYEQRQFLREQNERARLNLTVDLLLRYVDRFESQHFLRRRRAAARYLIHQVFAYEDLVEVEELNRAGWDVCAFFEDLAHLQRIEALPAATVWNSFGSVVRTYWPLCRPAIEKLRQEWKVTALYEEFEHLSSVLADLEREQYIEAPTNELLRQVIEDEAIAGEDEAILGEEPFESE
jgi:hypothetical protein